MKFRYFFFIVIMFLTAIELTSGQSIKSNNAEKLYEEAVYHMEGTGDYEKAIELLNHIVKDYASNKPLASRALLQLGISKEKLGKKEAEKAYRRVIEEYGSEREIVLEARSRLLALEELRRIDPTGVVAQRVWTGEDVDILGSPSPDGNYLSFVDWFTGNLAIRDLTTGENKAVTDKGTWADSDEYAEFSVFSPDGKQLAFSWFNETMNAYELRLISRNGLNEQVLHSHPETFYVQPIGWTPDKKHIITVFTKQDRTNQIGIVKVEDGTVRTLKSFDWRYPGVHLSPDGQWIAYDFPLNEDASQRDIFLLSLDGTQESVLVESPAHDYLLGWSPDSEYIIFASDRTGNISGLMLQVTKGKPAGSAQVIRRDLGRIRPIGLTDDGVLFYGMGRQKDVHIAEFDPKTSKLTSTPNNATDRFQGTNATPAWSPDGKHLAFISRRGPYNQGIGSNAIVIRSLESGIERDLFPKVNLTANRNFTRLYWTKDGNFLLTEARDEKGRRGVYKIEIQSAEFEMLYHLDEQNSSRLLGKTSDDGSRFLIKKHTEDRDVLIHIDTDLNEEHIVHESPHIHHAALSPDGTQVAYTTVTEKDAKEQDPRVANSNRLVIQPVTGKTSQEIFKVPIDKEITTVLWTKDQQSVFFTISHNLSTNLPEDNQIWRIAVEGGDPELLDLTFKPWQMRGVQFHPSSNKIAFTVADWSGTEIWLMENFLPSIDSAESISGSE